MGLVEKHKPSTIKPYFHAARASESKKLHLHTCTFLLRSAIKVSFSVAESTTLDHHLEAPSVSHGKRNSSHAKKKIIPCLLHILLYFVELLCRIHTIYITADVFPNAHQYLANKTNGQMTILFRHQRKVLSSQIAHKAQAMLVSAST